MLVSLNPLRLYEIIAGYAKERDKYVLFIDLKTWLALDSTKKATVKTYYADYIDEDEIGEVFDNDMTFYEFGSEALATEKAQAWFPLNTSLTDQDYFIECQVITPTGSISYTNKTTANPA